MCETITMPDGKEIKSINIDRSCLCTNTNTQIITWIARQVPDIDIGQKLIIEHTPFGWDVSIEKGDFLPVAVLFYSLGICGGVLVVSLIEAPKKQSTVEKVVNRYGQVWYSTRAEAEKNRHPFDRIVYDKNFEKYYIEHKKNMDVA